MGVGCVAACVSVKVDTKYAQGNEEAVVSVTGMLDVVL